MKKRNQEAAELLLMTGLCGVVTAISVGVQHARWEFMLFLTILMAVMSFVARFRRKDRVQTLQARGYRIRR